jgi:hypothetical protein
MTTFVVAGDAKILAEYYLVYKDVRGVMTGYVCNNRVSFGNIPRDREVTLVAVSFVDKQAYFFKATIAKPAGGVVPVIALKPVEESFLNKELALLK